MREKLKALEKLLSPFACLLRGIPMGSAQGERDIFLCGEVGEQVSFLKDKPKSSPMASE
jgi:hypothetical protein